MSAYTPRWTDPRIQRHIAAALTWAVTHLSATHARPVYCRTLIQHLGRPDRPLGQYVRQHLLITTDDWYNHQTGQCKQYRLNTAGAALLAQLAQQTLPQPQLPPAVAQQAESGEFEYTDKSDRWFNPAQNIPRQVRGSLLANHGYRYNYDIEAAAPTLLLQRAQQIDPLFAAPALTHYTQNRTQQRQQMALESGLTSDQIKTVINAVLQGGVLTTWQQGSISRALNNNTQGIRRLQVSPTYQAIRNDIRRMWAVLAQHMDRQYTTTPQGRQRLRAITGADKSQVYRQLERQVAKVIRRELRRQRIQALWLHDGWCANQLVDTDAVITQVRQRTGFRIVVDYNIYQDIVDTKEATTAATATTLPAISLRSNTSPTASTRVVWQVPQHNSIKSKQQRTGILNRSLPLSNRLHITDSGTTAL